MALKDRIHPAAAGIVLAIAFASPAPAQTSASDASAAAGHLHAILQQSMSGSMQTTSFRYVGPGSCSAVACHGGIQPRDSTKVLQNEYSTWVTSDKHARAYAVLSEPLGRQMGAILKIGDPAKAQKCLVCHAVVAGPNQGERDYGMTEGVSCESCHGPASAWLGPHIQPTARHADMVRLGLVDNKSLTVRAERCLTCHLGAPGLSVDHEMIAAGHPDLYFELDSFTAIEPPHWVEKGPDQKDPIADPLFGVRAWSIGEAVQLRESMQRLARRAHSGPWPEFSEMDCITCHHSLTGPLSWRQKEGYRGHRPGDPPYNLSRYVVFRHFANDVDAGLNADLERELTKVAALVTSMSPDRAEVETSANHAAELADRMLARVRDAHYDRAQTERLIKAISEDGDAIAAQGERTAEQATMTVDSLYIAYARDGGPNAQARAAIDGLLKQVNNPSAYVAPQFAAQLRKVGATLH